MERSVCEITTILFDFDGVIADTEPENAKRLAGLLTDYGVTVSADDMMAFAGMTDRDVMERYAPQMRTRKDVDELLRELDARPSIYETGDIRPGKGLCTLLTELRDSGIKTAIVSSSMTRLLITALNRMSMLHLFDAVIGGDMVREHKPSPEGYLLAMRFLDAAASKTVVIEDSPAGIRAGRQAGAYVIGYRGTGQSGDGADVCVNAFDEVRNLGIFQRNQEE